jgi:16S rRNA (adenine1518-N6/adenine1519-N6)-dimethyltransferase
MTNPVPPPRQTLSYLRSLLAGRGLRPKNKLGQSFLIDLNLLDLIVRAAELDREDLIIEVGTGTGGLTARLADQAGSVLSVEIDPGFHELANRVLRDRTNVFLMRADILHGKNELNAEVLARLTELRASATRLKLVANFPYAVATPVISNFLLSDFTFERMVVMVQWEIAERFAARPSTKDYGALSVLIQSLADVEIVRRLTPASFWPRPLVDSAIVLIRPNAAKRAHVGDPQRFRVFLRDLYVHRRKNLRVALSNSPSGRRPKEEVDKQLTELGIDGTLRAEALDLEQHLRLSRIFGQAGIKQDPAAS